MPQRILKKIKELKEGYQKARNSRNKKENQEKNREQAEYQKLKKILVKKEKKLKKQLNRFARRRKSLKGDYKARFPVFGTGKDEDSQELERYESRVSMEHQLELELQKVQRAIKRIEQGKYGICLKCGRKISLERLKVYPEAEYCMKCRSEEKSAEA